MTSNNMHTEIVDWIHVKYPTQYFIKYNFDDWTFYVSLLVSSYADKHMWAYEYFVH